MPPEEYAKSFDKGCFEYSTCKVTLPEVRKSKIWTLTMHFQVLSY